MIEKVTVIVPTWYFWKRQWKTCYGLSKKKVYIFWNGNEFSTPFGRNAFNGLNSFSYLELKVLERVLTDSKQMKVLFRSQTLFTLFKHLLAKLIKRSYELIFYALSVCGHYFVRHWLRQVAFSTYSFGKLVFCLSVFSANPVFRFHLLMTFI